MKNKRSTIIKLILLILLLLFLVASLILGLLGSKYGFTFMPFFNFDQKIVYENKYTIEEISIIQVDTNSANIIVKNHEEKDIKVVIYDKDDKFLNVNIEDKKLNINNTSVNLCIGFCYTKKVVEIYLPNEHKVDLKLHATSGNIKVHSFINKISITATSGNVEVDKANDIEIKVKSGNIKVGESNIVNLEATSGNIKVNKSNGGNVKTFSGNIHIDNLEAIENSTISATSGNVYIGATNDIYISASATSGDVKVKDSNRFSEIELSISTKSGNIKVK